MDVEVTKSLAQHLSPVIEEYNQSREQAGIPRETGVNKFVNMESVLKRIQKSVPPFVKFAISTLIEESKNDPFFTIHLGLNTYFKQQLQLGLSLVLLFLSLGCIVFSV